MARKRNTVGGARPGAGRPPEPDARRAWLTVRVRAEDLARARAAETGSRKLADFMREKLNDFAVSRKST
jgi:hypothetical protein